MILRTFTPVIRLTFTLLLLLAGGSSARAQQPSPPQIFFAETPALLVRIDGAPVYRHVPGTDLARIVNTRAVIVKDAAGIHYMKVLDGWMESYDLMSHWSVSGASPFGDNRTIERTVVPPTADQPPQTLASTTSLDDNPPSIFVSTRPAALIVTDGAPRYETAPGTSLRYLANSQAKVFLEPTDDEIYVQVGPDWYRAWSTDGPWGFIPSTQLPADIARYIAR